MGKKVLFISYDGLTDPLGQSQILPYHIGLANLGHQITILSCEKPDNYLKNRALIKEKIKAANIKWIPTHYKSKVPVISPALNSKKLKHKAFEISKIEKFDIVHCRSIIPAIIGEKIIKKMGGKLIYDIRGFWADERIDGNIWNKNNPIFNYLYRHFKRKEKFMFERADAIVTLTQNAKQYIASNFTTNNLFEVIPCCVDFNHFNINSISDKAVEDLRTTLNIPSNSYVLLYVGSLGARYQLREMLKFFKALKNIVPTACFLFITKSETTAILPEAKVMGLDISSIFITSCEYEDIPKHILLGNASIFFIVTSFSGKAVSPTKQAEVMSMGLPIIANSGLGDTDLILNTTKSGVVVKNYKSETLSKAATELMDFSTTKETIINAAKEKFSLEKGVQLYHNLYNKL